MRLCFAQISIIQLICKYPFSIDEGQSKRIGKHKNKQKHIKTPSDDA